MTNASKDANVTAARVTVTVRVLLPRLPTKIIFILRRPLPFITASRYRFQLLPQ